MHMPLDGFSLKQKGGVTFNYNENKTILKNSPAIDATASIDGFIKSVMLESMDIT